MSASVDVGSGNLMVSTIDRTAPSIQGLQAFGLTYQSMSQGTSSQLKSGAAGQGWFMTMGQDNRLVSNDDGSLLYLGTDAQQGKFTPISGSSGYSAPAGFKKSLVKNSDGTYSMTDLRSRVVSKFGTDGRLVSQTNRSGQATTFAYSGGNVSSVTLPTGQKLAVSFANGKISSITRPANGSLAAGTVTYSYDSSGRLSAISRPAVGGSPASTVGFGYDGSGNLVLVSTDGHLLAMAYDGSHRVTAVTHGTTSDTAKTRFSYVSSTQTQVAAPTTDQNQDFPSVPHTTYTINSSQRVTSVTDPLGRKRDTSYTPFFDVASQTNGMGGTATGAYGANGGASLTKATSAFGASQSYTYGTGNNAYDPASGTDAQGNSSLFTYDGSGRPASTTSSGAKAEVSYYDDGLPKTSTDPAGRQTTYTEDPSAKYITKITPPSGSPMGATTISGNPATSVTNGAGQTTTYTYNDRYRVDKVATATQSVSYTYDASGRVTSRTDKNQKVTYGYDARGNVSEIAATPVAGGSAPAASTVSYTYDKSGNIASRTVAGSTTKYVYDDANQLLAMTLADGSITSFKYNNAGQRTDTYWRTNSDNSQFAAHSRSVFGAGGNLAQQWTSVKSDDSNRLYDYSYCNAKYADAPTCPWNTSSSLNTGKIQYIKNGKTGAITQLGYDNRNRLVSASNWEGHSYAYTYDSVGNRTSVKRDGTTVQSLTYNAANQISSSGYDYDKAGRRTAAAGQGSTTWNDLGQTSARTNGTSSGTYSYAGEGQDELIQQKDADTTKTYVWGRTNQAGVPTMEHSTYNGVATVIDNDSAGMPLNYKDGGQNLFVMFDGLGRMVGTVGEDGAQTSKYTYDPFLELTDITYPAGTAASKEAAGKATELNASGAGQVPWSTTGVQDEVVKGYWKRGTRWHDTATGTWTSVDPITKLNDPNRANPYTYTSDDPINRFDPAGRDDGIEGWFETVGKFAGGGGGVGAAVGCAVTIAAGCVEGAVPGGAIGTAGGGAFGIGYATAEAIWGDD
ncbi:RHS repeat-associated core domain-containing protein [Luteipulveratus halotolerans]|uniref:Teneurin-like YD-shell domain-containing protein n=1 Tax=Luteipulveratus halotolerans TaxID=1631356 RepID=A0A0L6CF09_9MICO|nr:RHS repeat-associated core domain-containing protein [Luteipulveratus halotolerans]KNX36160.1 hypothetical protein VV01_01745 [Luteipulveratus halotolerans]